MSTSGLPIIGPAAEGPYPALGAAPPDQQPVDLAGALAMVDSIIWRDNGMDQQEQATFFAWVQNTVLKIEAQNAAVGTQGLAQSGATGSANTPYNPMAGDSDAGMGAY